MRNLLDPDIDARMEAKRIHLARRAKAYLENPGQPLKLPTSDAEKAELMRHMQEHLMGCKGDPTCSHEMTLQYAAIMATVDFPRILLSPAQHV